MLTVLIELPKNSIPVKYKSSFDAFKLHFSNPDIDNIY
jgi:hypothetical protein